MKRHLRMTLDEGLVYIKTQPYRKLNDRHIEKNKSTRLKMFASGQLECIRCGLKGTHFYIEHAVRDKIMPMSVNLYGFKGDEEIMLTWDHILPKSLGGSDSLENAQCMCERCNSEKGNELTLLELITIATHNNPLAIFKLPKTVQDLSQIGVNSIWDTLRTVKKEKIRPTQIHIRRNPIPVYIEPVRYDSSGKEISKGIKYKTTVLIDDKFKTIITGTVSRFNRKQRVTLKVSSQEQFLDDVPIVRPKMKFVTVKSETLARLGV